MSRFLLLIILSVSLSGCLKGEPCLDMKFDRLSKVNRIVITDNLNNELRIIQDESTIHGITNFVLNHGSDWETPWYGTPIAKVRANFFVDGKFAGDFGVGNDFLTAQGCRGFQSRGVSAKDRSEIMRLFSVLDPYAMSK